MSEARNDFKLVGLRLKGQTTNQDNQSSKDCGDLWQKFEADKIFDQIPDKLSNEVYAVYFDYEKDETGTFSYFIGCKVAKDSIPPKGLESLTIPHQKYQKHLAKGAMPACITDAWRKIWISDSKREFGFDFEVYGERCQDWSNAEVDIFVSVTD
ncbi:GyrI-like domain-containing protein [Mongoliibacter ruber]|uniref:Putative transcriptional regulator YdeE n=1 Tax=Mongoliibacter ruber TaxID=1750599 RepID=A0A2T0WTF7_9BACT|nr:GyrI-like domain-containing protein [Mongoliibacter ruber]PRY89947.1 putative transcriptional regulator YdeE [Mongoliibacter ruber]